VSGAGTIGSPCTYEAAAASFSRNSSTCITSTLAFGMRRKGPVVWIHLVDVFGVEVQKLLREWAWSLGSRAMAALNDIQVFVSELKPATSSSRFDFFHLRQPELVNLVGREICRGALFHEERVVGVAIRQRPYARLVRPCGA